MIPVKSRLCSADTHDSDGVKNNPHLLQWFKQPSDYLILKQSSDNLILKQSSDYLVLKQFSDYLILILELRNKNMCNYINE